MALLPAIYFGGRAGLAGVINFFRARSYNAVKITKKLATLKPLAVSLAFRLIYTNARALFGE